MTRHSIRFVVFACVVAAGMSAVLFALNGERPAPREIHIVIRDMAFYVNDDTSPNPAIVVAPGESVALIVRNDDAGIVHDFGVPAWASSTRRLRAGESQRLVLQAPAATGGTPYHCSPHSRMMSGEIVVR